MTPMRANIVGPPDVATRDQRLHCRLPLRGRVLRLRKLGDVGTGVLEGDELASLRM
jgi:hypothetical protein